MQFKNIKSILIVCTGNICRSPMAEGVLKYKLNQAGLAHIQVNSAGTSGWDNQTPTFEAVQACSEIGIDISKLCSAPISEQMIQSADLIVAMEKYHINEIIKLYNTADKLYLLGDFHADKPGMEINDPYGMPIFYYQKILDLICQCSNRLIDKLDAMY